MAGLALPPETEPALFTLLGALPGANSRFADIRDAGARSPEWWRTPRPRSCSTWRRRRWCFARIASPSETYATNVHGHGASAGGAPAGAVGAGDLSWSPATRSTQTPATAAAYRETDPLGGADPYSASQGRAEIAVASLVGVLFRAARRSRWRTARAGNVIGGGDWSEHRLVPDVWRAAWAGADPMLRHPEATRPWQHVLDCVAGYFVYVQALLQAPAATLPLALNFGPPAGREAPVAAVADAMLASLGGGRRWTRDPGAHPPERHALQLDAGLAERTLGWRARLDLAQTLAWTADWYRAFDRGADVRAMSLAQIAAYREMCAT